MSVPQMKEGPASMLRAMFAGFGSLLSVMDKIRAKPAAEAPAETTAAPRGHGRSRTTPRPEPEAGTAERPRPW